MQLSIVRDHFRNHVEVVTRAAEHLAPAVLDAAKLLTEALRGGNKVLVMGNGGSAADAQHLAAELVGRFRRERKGLPVIALTTDTSILTAVGNDYGFEEVFSRQVEALAAAGDVVVGISTSGRSPNIRRALLAANAIGCTTIGLLGRDGGEIAGLVSLGLIVPDQETPHIQEVHAVIVHILCDLVERELCGCERT